MYPEGRHREDELASPGLPDDTDIESLSRNPKPYMGPKPKTSAKPPTDPKP